MTDAAISRLSAALADRYRLERELGQGGMATVYLAQDLKHDRRVAIKVLKPELAAVLGADRFIQEIKTTAALSHPHILPLFDSGEAEGFLYYVMPYIEGETVREKLNRETQFGIEEAVRITTQVADALDYAHRHGVIHRDIKPENILLHDGRPMVADFGIALAVSAAAGSRMTETGLSLGTPHYMSPEQATAEKEITGRSDIYSLASVLYEMLTGQPPHTGSTAQQIIVQIIADPAPPVTERRKNVPPNVAAAMAKALEKVPADRFATAAEFVHALQDPAYRLADYSGARAPWRTRFRALVPWAIAVGAVAVAVSLVLRAPASTGRAGHVVRFVIPRAASAATSGEIAIAPDGRFIVYRDVRDGVARLYRRDFDAVDPHPLPGTEGGGWPTVSPDGKSLAFVGSDASLLKAGFEGAPPARITKLSVSPVGVGWSRRFGLVLGMQEFSDTNGLSVVPDSAGAAIRQLTKPGGGADLIMHHEPYVLPDGEAALFLNWQRGSTTSTTLGVVTLSDGTWRDLGLPILEDGGIAGVADGVLVYLDPVRNLMAVPFDLARRRITGDPVRIPDAPAGIAQAVLAGDGTLALHVQPQAFRLEVVDERGVGLPVLPDTVAYAVPRYSPDGRRIAFSATIRGRSGVWVDDLRGATLMNIPPSDWALDVEWAPDGRRILFNTYSEASVRALAADGSDTGAVLYEGRSGAGLVTTAVLALDRRTLVLGTHDAPGGDNIDVATVGVNQAARPFVSTASSEGAPRLSPDGKWIAYVSDESGRYEVYARPFPAAGPRIQVSNAGGIQPVWSPTGARLFYRLGKALIAADIALNAPRGSFQVVRRQQLFEMDSYVGLPGAFPATYDVAPDGRHFLIARRVGETEPAIMVWINWLPALKAKLMQR
ncbi:MAG TPA: protein kinase [Gemmatimonadales bacterium]|nr:protein kinase [Gemmatimonadales bacterium]